MTKVSIIIAAYNAMSFLPETLESVFRQTWSDYEVIIVNDGSSDGIEKWVAQINDSRVKFISQKNQGISVARNNALALAEGEYIAFLDADDLWQSTKLEKQVRILDEHPEVGLVYSWIALIDERSNLQGKIRKNSAEGNIWKKLLEHNLVECGSNPMVRGSCFEDVGLFDPRFTYAQGWEMWLRIARHYPFKAIKEPLVYYRSHSNNSSKNWKALEPNYRAIIEKTFADVPSHLQYLKGRSYGFANVYIAWKILQSPSEDYQKALHFQKQATIQYPQIRHSQEYIRLSFALTLVRLFGFEDYNKIRNYIYSLKQKTSNLFEHLDAFLISSS